MNRVASCMTIIHGAGTLGRIDNAFRDTSQKPSTSFVKCDKMMYKIAEFPQSLAKPDGNILVAPIYGHLKSRKRKRSELTIALDCEGINLYEVNPTLPKR